VVEKEDYKKEMVSLKVPMRKFSKERYYRAGMYVHTNTILFRSCCKELMLDALNRGFLNDIFITFCMLQFGKMVYIPNAWAQYNFNGTGLWTGAKKVYSSFRNLHTYDLEVNIDPKFEKTIFDSIWGNMSTILNDYKEEDIQAITPLVKNLDPGVFKYTLALYKLDNLSPQEQSFKKHLKNRFLISRVRSKLYRIYDSMINAILRIKKMF
jgi:hypothetical protein